MNMRGRLFDDGYGGATFPEPRPFQITAHEALREGARAGHRCQMIMAPTGAGKSYLGLRIAHEALLKGKRALFVCDRTTLINQTSETADSYGLSDHGIIQAQHWRRDKSMPLQVASVQTLARRNWPDADVIIIDEAHTQHSAWVEHAKSTRAAVIGLSATPFSRGLGRTFTNLINAATMRDLTGSGVLVPMRVFSCTKPDMKGAETKAGGEWADRAAEERGMVIIGDVVSEWAKFASDRKTIVFGATIKHCEEIVRQFNEAGIMAAVFTSLTSDVERKSLLEEYRKPDSMIRVLVSVEALAKGFDVQDVGCVCDCRPLRKSLSTAIQMWGRGLRSSPGKKDCLLLDFSGNIIRFADDFSEIFYGGLDRLDDGEKLDRAIRNDDEKPSRKCPNCGFSPCGKRCISCGYEAQSPALVVAVPGKMKEIFIGGAKCAEDAAHLYAQACMYARTHSAPEKQAGRAANIYRSITGKWPPNTWRFESTVPAEVSRPVLNKIRSGNIAFSKGRGRTPELFNGPAPTQPINSGPIIGKYGSHRE